MATKKFDNTVFYIRIHQPTTCPFCGVRTDVFLDLFHTRCQIQVQKCLNPYCSFEFYELTDESDLTPKVKLSYLYRDAANYKLFNSVVFINPDNITLEHVGATIRRHLIDGEFFDTNKWDLPKPEFDDFDDEVDHDWCEFEGLEFTDEEADADVTISEFLDIVEGKSSPQS